MKTLIASLLLAAAAATPAAAGPDFVSGDHPNKELAASDGTKRQTPLDDVVFENDSAALLSSAHQQIESAAAWLKKHPKEKVVLEGHADSIGAAAYNEDLAMRRADMVRKHLIGHGIASDRIIAVAYGEHGSEKRPSPTDRRVVLFTTRAPVNELVKVAMDRGARTASWTRNKVLFTENAGSKNVNAKTVISRR